jgi:hypothetical protein
MNYDILHMLNLTQEFAFYLFGYLMASLYGEVLIYSYFYINSEASTQSVRLDAIDCLNPSSF